MIPSTRARSALSSFLQSLRSIGLSHKLRTFILRCLLFIFRNLKGVWSRYFPTGSNVSDGKKTEGSVRRPPYTRSSWKREEYSVVCASQAFGRADGQSLRHSLSRSSDREEPIQLGPVIGRSSSMPHSPSSSYSLSLQDSPRHSVDHLPLGNPNNSSGSLRPETPMSTMELVIHRSSTPVSWTHPRATSRQFTGASSRSRPRRPSPSPSTSLFHRHFSRPDTPPRVDIEVPTHTTAIRDTHGSPENSAHSPTDITVQVEQPSMPGSPATSSTSPSRLSPLHDRMQHLDTHQQLPSTESVNSSADSSRSRGRPSVLGAHRNAHPSQGSIRAPSSSPSLIRAPLGPSIVYPESSVSRISFQVSVSTALNAQSRTATRSLRPMHSEQVSRYVKKGDV
jgi:hypothetical protein